MKTKIGFVFHLDFSEHLLLKQTKEKTKGPVRWCSFGKKVKGHMPCKSTENIWQMLNNQVEKEVIDPVLESTKPTKLFSLKMKEEVIN